MKATFQQLSEDGQNLGAYIRGLYPVLDIKRLDKAIQMSDVAAEGVIVAPKAYESEVPPAGCPGIFIARKIPHTILGHLDRVSGIVTLKEDKSSHLSIVCRAKGIPVVNLAEPEYQALSEAIKSKHVYPAIAIDTFEKRIVLGDIGLNNRHVLASRQAALACLKKEASLSIHANADTAEDIRSAVSQNFNHSWPRSETLLYQEDTMDYFIAFLLEPENREVSEKFIGGHASSILALFKEARGTRIGFRLLDPPSHEFLPDIGDTRAIKALSRILKKSQADIKADIICQTETNPMIGHRGARLLLTNKSLLRAQVLSMLSAWHDTDQSLRPPCVEILVPFVMLPAELREIKAHIKKVIQEQPRFLDTPVRYGCMVELPSLLNFPEEVAQEADFVSFGTNDLVAVSHGIARGDSYDRYLKQYIDNGIFEQDPFFVIPPYILKQISDFCLKAKQINPAIETDICGEQALSTDLSSLIDSGALNSVSIGTESLPIFLSSFLANRAVAPKNPENKLESFTTTQPLKEKNMLGSTIDKLNSALKRDFSAVNCAANPVATAYPDYSYQQKLHVMGQYSLFSRFIVGFLTETLYKATLSECSHIASEMKQNISEEMGFDHADHPPHYMLLCKGFADKLGIDAYSIEPSAASKAFYDSVISEIKSHAPAYAAGVTYALESSAVPELEMTKDMVYALFTERGADVPHQVQQFFESHIGEIEIGHDNRLKEACLKDLKNLEDEGEFENGYKNLMEAMDTWWKSLDIEAIKLQPIGNGLAPAP